MPSQVTGSDASLVKYLADLGGAVVGLAAFATVVGFFCKPLLDKLWVWQMKRSRVEHKAELDEIYKDRMKRVDRVIGMVDDLNDRFEMLFQSQKQQGEAMIEQQKSTAEAHARSLEKISETLESIHEESMATAKAVSHLYGLMEKDNPWDGIDRRRRPRA